MLDLQPLHLFAAQLVRRGSAAALALGLIGLPHGLPLSAVRTPAATQESKPADQHVSGKVVDKDGKAVDKAEVVFKGPKRDKVWTDSHGAFAFAGPAGDYVITVKAGDRSQTFKVKLENNELKPSATLVIEPEK